MQVRRNMLLVILALLAGTTLAATWKNKHLENWDNGWDQNIFGEPIDVNTACDGKPCIKHKLPKPETRFDNAMVPSAQGPLLGGKIWEALCMYKGGCGLLNELQDDKVPLLRKVVSPSSCLQVSLAGAVSAHDSAHASPVGSRDAVRSSAKLLLDKRTFGV